MEQASNDVLAAQLGSVREDLYEIKRQLETLATRLEVRDDQIEKRVRDLERAESRTATVIAILATVGTAIGGMAVTALLRGPAP